MNNPNGGLIALLFFWCVAGGVWAMIRVEEEGGLFINLSWAQIIMFCFLLGPTWILLFPLVMILMLIRKMIELWNLLGGVGKR